MGTINLYNPLNLSPKELIDSFIIRQKEFEKIISVIQSDLMQKPSQHFIIQGIRGSGKTTLLLRIYYEIKRDINLQKWLIPVMFNEEQYGVTKLFKLWEKIAVELENEDTTYLGLVDEMQEYDSTEYYEENCYRLLFSKLANTNKKIIVFIDNFGDLLGKFTKKEQQRLREVLITNSNIRIIGASSVIMESTYDYKEPFYEFFKIINLDELKREDALNLLLQLDKANEHHAIQTIIDNNPGRIDALRILTGGIPRTIVLLYEIFVHDINGESFHDLEILLDRVTPLYKHRMDDLPAQQQEIVDVIALNWDAMPVKEIASKTRLVSKVISAQLNLLERNNIIIKKPTSTKNHLYQLKERFFNIWYIMRNGRKTDKTKVKWLTKFLEIWCDSCEIEKMIKNHIQKLRLGNVYDQYAYHISEAYAQLAPSAELQNEVLEEAKKYLCTVKSDLSNELSLSDNEFIDNEVKPLLCLKEYSKAIQKLKTSETRTGIKEREIADIYLEHLNDKKMAEEYYLRAVNKGNTEAMFRLALLYKTLNDYENAERFYVNAAGKGNTYAMYNLALLYKNDLKDYKKAEDYYLMAIDKGYIYAMFNLALLYHELKEYEKAQKYYQMAIDKGYSQAINSLGILHHELKNFKKAEECYQMAIEMGDTNAKNNLAWLLFQQKRNKSAALKYAESSYSTAPKFNVIHTYALILLWNNEIQKSIEVSGPLWKDKVMIESNFLDITLLLNMFIAKKQYNFVLKLFTDKQYDLKDKFKPIYYALMHHLKDTHPDELNKMGEELKEPVQNILSAIKQMEVDYA